MNYNFDSIAGYEKEKEELIRLCEIFNNRDKYESKGAKLPKGIIFYGEAGTGKTLFSKILASVCNFKILKIDIGDVENVSKVCKCVKKTFKIAFKSKEPVMIFFDELDKVLPNRFEEYYTDQSKVILTQLLTLIDGMDSGNNIIFVATCNDYESLPNTLVRPGRIDKKIGLAKPNFNSKVQILNMYINNSNCTFETTTENIARLCVGFSCAALETLINECVLLSDENLIVSDKIIQDKILEIKNEDITREKSNLEKRIQACRNIGSFIVARTLNDGDYFLNLARDSVCNNFFNGILSRYDEDYEDEDYEDEDDDEDDENEEDEIKCGYYSKNDLLNTITVLLGGYIAEEIILRNLYDNVGHCLHLIDQILLDMSFQGMLGLGNRYSTGRNRNIPYLFDRVEEINYKFNEIIDDCYIKAEPIISRNKILIEKLIPILMEKEFVYKESCEYILNELGGIK